MIDLEKIKAFYNFGKELTLQDVQQLLSHASKRSFAPTEYIIREGSEKRELFLITKGLIRSFLINDKGDEITTALFYENLTIVNSDMILYNTPSRSYYQAIEQTETFSIDYDTLQDIIKENSLLESSRKQILLNVIKEFQERIESFILYSPEERYLNYIENNSEILNRVPDKYIANILGITPVSLSRIRKRIALKNR